uniref:Calponin-homology (CH) domain-containing protein n=1 Tax=Odontella aurita TaxID=265563 RepID=A0A7S4IHQ8_9STRA
MVKSDADINESATQNEPSDGAQQTLCAECAGADSTNNEEPSLGSAKEKDKENERPVAAGTSSELCGDKQQGVIHAGQGASGPKTQPVDEKQSTAGASVSSSSGLKEFIRQQRQAAVSDKRKAEDKTRGTGARPMRSNPAASGLRKKDSPGTIAPRGAAQTTRAHFDNIGAPPSSSGLRDYIQLCRTSLRKEDTDQGKQPKPVMSPNGGGVLMDLSSVFAAHSSSPGKRASDLNRNKHAEKGFNRAVVEELKATPIVSLGHFSESLWLDFGDNNAVGKSRTLSFLLQAPQSDEPEDYYSVEIEKVPFKKGFNLEVDRRETDLDVEATALPNGDGGVETCSKSNIGIAAYEETDQGPVIEKVPKTQATVLRVRSGGSMRMNLIWTPAIAGGVREVVHLKLPRGRIRITAHGKARVMTDKSSASIRKNRRKSTQLRHRSGSIRKAVASPRHNRLLASVSSTPYVSSAGSSIAPGTGLFETPSIGSRITTHAQTTSTAPNFEVPSKIYSKASPGGSVTSASEARIRITHDDKWADKQCESFAKWLNYTFRPSEDAAHEKSLQEEGSDQNSMDRLALRTLLLHRRRAQARQRAAELYSNAGMKSVRQAIESEVATGRLAIRSDRDVFADVSLRSQLFSLLFSYATPWLRLGLETVLGVAISADLPSGRQHPIKGESKKKSVTRSKAVLKQFIIDRMISDPRIVMKYTKGRCKVPSGKWGLRYKEEQRKHALQTLLLLITFLDRAKSDNILKTVPCLFTKKGVVKSSKDVLVTICRDYLFAEGNIMKHLGHIGVAVHYIQDPRDEFNYTVKNLAVDLRDGVRLSRMIEILTNDDESSLLPELRVPAVSRLQKLHNAGIALGAMEYSGVPNLSDISGHHIVDGHRAPVLKLLWAVIAHFQFTKLLDEQTLQQEIEKVRRANKSRQSATAYIINTTKPVAENSFLDESIIHDGFDIRLIKLLLQWCQTVCSCFGFQMENFTTSFADGKAICLLLHYYHPGILRQTDILPTTRDLDLLPEETGKKQSAELSRAISNERRNSNLANKRMLDIGGIPGMLPTFDSRDMPEEKSIILCVAFLCSRLMESSNEILATIAIQGCYRRYRQRVLANKKKMAALVIWRAWEENKEIYYHAQRQTYKRAVNIIEAFAFEKKETLKKIQVRRIKKEKEVACACVLQSIFRMHLAKIHYRKQYRQHTSAITVQSHYRSYHRRAIFFMKRLAAVQVQAVMRGFKVRTWIEVRSIAATTLQTEWRRFWAELQYSCDLLDIVTVQSLTRQILAMREVEERKSAALVMQCASRCWLANQRRRNLGLARDYSSRKIAASIFCQSLVRKKIARAQYHVEVQSARSIQSYYITYRQRRWFMQTRHAVVEIQSSFRGYLVRSALEAKRHGAERIQTAWRRYSAELRYSYQIMDITFVQSCARRMLVTKLLLRRKNAIATVQCTARCWIARRQRCALEEEREHHHRLVEATRYCQSMVRMKQAQSNFRKQLQRYRSVCRIQSTYRLFQQYRIYQPKKTAAVLIQSNYRGHSVRKEVKERNLAATKIQTAWRRYSGQLQFLQSLVNVILAQSCIKRYLAMRQASNRRASVLKIQCAVRQNLSRRRRAGLREEAAYIVRLDAAATLCQCLVRQRFAKREYSNKLVEFQSAAAIQSHFRARMQKCQYDCSRKAAVSIQSYFRGYVVRCNIEERIFGAIIIQTEWRRFWAEFHYSLDFLSIVLLQAVVRRRLATGVMARRLSALISIQSAARSWLATKRRFALQEAKKYSHALHAAATLCQSLVRRNAARAHFCTKLAEFQSAKVIQSEFRMRTQTRQFDRVKQGTIQFQVIYRAHMIRTDLAKQRAAATKVQAAWRGFSSELRYSYQVMGITFVQSCWRRKLAQIHTMQCKSAVEAIQCAARCWLVTRRTCMLREARNYSRSLVEATIVCQSMVRKKQARAIFFTTLVDFKSARAIQACYRMYFQRGCYKTQRTALIQVQALHRGHVVRKGIHEQLLAAIAIQAEWRKFAASQKYYHCLINIILAQCCMRRALARNSRVERDMSLLRIQCASRQWLARLSLCERRQERQYSVRLVAVATFCQGMYRRKTAIARYHERLAQAKSASIIQRRWRSYVCQSRFSNTLSGVILIQSLTRRNIAVRYVRDIAQKNEEVQATVTIQAWMRMALAKFWYKKELAAIAIQKIWRGYTANVDFLLSTWSAIRIQAIVRQMVARKNYCQVRRGITLFQALCRGSAVRRCAMGSTSCAIRIQALYRGFRARYAFSERRRAAIQIQSAARGMIARTDVEIQHYAASEIQRMWRGYEDNVDYILMLLSAIKIQAAFRRSAACRCVALMKQDALFDLVESRHKNDAASKIQSVFRYHLHRRRLVRVVVTAQRVVRGFLARRRAERIMKGIVRLQSAYRGQKTRLSSPKKVRLARKKIERANEAALAEPHMRLGVRTSVALHILQTSKRLAEVMKAVLTLETATRLSDQCCVAFAGAGAPSILYALVRTCNRSLPHMELLHHVLLTLKNVAEYSELIDSVATANSVDILMDLLQMFRDKDDIFSTALVLMDLIVFSKEEFLVLCGRRENMKRLKGIHFLCQRKMALSRKGGSGPPRVRRALNDSTASEQAHKSACRGIQVLENIITNARQTRDV